MSAALIAGLLLSMTTTMMMPLAGCRADEVSAAADVPPPQIAQAPRTAAVLHGASATFSVRAQGAGPLVYQWQRDGVPIAGAVTPHYTTAPVSAADHRAQYRVVVSNPGGMASTVPVVLQVVVAAATQR